MKAILVTGVAGLVIIGGMIFIPNGIEISKQTIEIEKTIEVDTLDKRIEDAIESAKASTTDKAQAAYDAVIQAEEQRISDEIKAKYIAEIEATISSDSPY